MQPSGPLAGTVGGLCVVPDTWATGLESSCTLLKGALPGHEVALAWRGFSVNWQQGPHVGLVV